jgi:hypothetical protein
MEHHGAGGPAWALALEDSALGEAVRQSLWIYPAANVLHVLAVAVMVGSIVAFDLRVLGAVRTIPVGSLARLLLPLAASGFAVALATGVPMFAADASAVWNNPVFPYKLGLIGLGIANIAVFHLGPLRSVDAWGAHGRSPGLAVGGAAVSILGWGAVAALGRLIAYF